MELKSSQPLHDAPPTTPPLQTPSQQNRRVGHSRVDHHRCAFIKPLTIYTKYQLISLTHGHLHTWMMIVRQRRPSVSKDLLNY